VRQTALRGLLRLSLCIELLGVVIQGLEQIGHLGGTSPRG
jgi:hypothetical protein